jgi:hypothetical protein
MKEGTKSKPKLSRGEAGDRHGPDHLHTDSRGVREINRRMGISPTHYSRRNTS